MQEGQFTRPERYQWRLTVAFGPTLFDARAGFTKNISAYGCALQTRTPLPPGSMVALAFRLDNGRFANGYAVVVWSRPPSDTGAMGAMGLQFERIDDAYFDFLLLVANPVLRDTAA